MMNLVARLTSTTGRFLIFSRINCCCSASFFAPRKTSENDVVLAKRRTEYLHSTVIKTDINGPARTDEAHGIVYSGTKGTEFREISSDTQRHASTIIYRWLWSSAQGRKCASNLNFFFFFKYRDTNMPAKCTMFTSFNVFPHLMLLKWNPEQLLKDNTKNKLEKNPVI